MAVKQYDRKTDNIVYGGKYITKQIIEAHTRVVICFDENKHPDYMNQFIKPIRNFGGDVMVSDLAKNPALDFTWLCVPMNIQSVLQEGWENMYGKILRLDSARQNRIDPTGFMQLFSKKAQAALKYNDTKLNTSYVGTTPLIRHL